MSVFWFFAGMLTMLAALIVVLPWLRTIPRFASLPAVPWQAPLIGLLIVAAALGMYRWLGTPEFANVPAGAFAGHQTAAADPSAAGSMQSAIDALSTRLAGGSGSEADWELLAQSYEFTGRIDDARLARQHRLASALPATAQPPTAQPATERTRKLLADAALARRSKQYAKAAAIYRRLAAANQMTADAWADFADTAGTLHGGSLEGEPEQYIAEALRLDPNQPKALWLEASADEEAGRLVAANSVWRKLQALLPPDSPDTTVIAANLERDERAVAAAAPAASGVSGVSVSGELSISDSLSTKAAAGATLFIVAKSVDSPGPPVAVFRGSVTSWPMRFTLDDSSSMLPGRNLSSAKHVTIEARISRSGQALPAAGDLRGTSGVIDPSSHQPLKIVIDEVVS